MFIDQQHKENFRVLAEKWSSVEKGNTEYVPAAYILAVPMLFERINVHSLKSPVEWIADYEYKYNDDFAKEYDLDESKRATIQIGYDLTNAMRQLGKLALHLWNSYKYFNLMDCLASLDDDNYNVAIYAIQIRFDRNLANHLITLSKQ